MNPIKLKNIANNVLNEFTTKHIAELQKIIEYSYEEKIASLWDAIITFTTFGEWMNNYDELARNYEFQEMIRYVAIERFRDEEPDMDEDSDEAVELIDDYENRLYDEFWYCAQNTWAVPRDVPETIREFVEDTIFGDIIAHAGNIETLKDASDPVRYFGEAIVKSVGEDSLLPNSVYPSWFWLTDPEVTKNTWMIHFTDEENRDEIIRNGFKMGVGNPKFTGWTTGFYDEIPGSDAENKYHFAYTVDYLLKEPDKFWRYGYSAVMFRASGITMYHYADREMQTVFSSPTAKDFVPIDSLNNNNAIVRGGKKTLKKGPLDEVMKWVVANYNQYRKVFSLNVPANEDDEHETN